MKKYFTILLLSVFIQSTYANEGGKIMANAFTGIVLILVVVVVIIALVVLGVKFFRKKG